MRPLRFLIGVAAVYGAGAISMPAFAQVAALQIRVVRASDGRPVAGATVIVHNAAIGLDRRLISDAGGVVMLDNVVTSGSYVVSAESGQGLSSAQSAPVTLRSGYTRSITLSLAVTPTSSDIVVTASRAVTGINQVNAEVSASLPKEALQALPIEARDVQSALIRLPNVVPSTGFFPEAPVVSINGANGLFTNYLIDGLDNNENFLGGLKFPVPLGFTQDVTVLANSYSARYGRTANGIVNYTTPSGSNDYHGEVYSLLRPGRPLDARSTFAGRDLTGNPVGSSFERLQAGATLGGPIVKDKTFFYADLEYTRDHNENVLDAPALGVGACNRSGVCSQTAGFSAHALCHWQVASCSNYLPMCSPSSGAACKRGVVLTLPANGFSKPVAGSRFCEEGFQNSFDKQQAAEMRCGHGPPARSSERKVFANRASA